MKLLHGSAVSLLTVMVTTVVLEAPAIATSSATSCHIVCDGVDPGTAMYEDDRGVLRKCNGISTVRSAYDGGVGVELRYSTTCRMAWARSPNHAITTFKVEGFNANGSLRVVYTDGGGDYTKAVNDAGLTARACVYVPFGDWHCTGRY